MLFGKVLLAAAGVYDQAERQREIHAFREMRNPLLDAVFEHGDLIGAERLHQSAARIARRKRHVYQIDLRVQRRRLLAVYAWAQPGVEDQGQQQEPPVRAESQLFKDGHNRRSDLLSPRSTNRVPWEFRERDRPSA